jgi:hypothetical protein
MALDPATDWPFRRIDRTIATGPIPHEGASTADKPRHDNGMIDTLSQAVARTTMR